MGRIVRVPLVVASASGYYKGIRGYATQSRHDGIVCITEIRVSPSVSGTAFAESQNVSYYPISCLNDGNFGYYPGSWTNAAYTHLPTFWGLLFSSGIKITAFEMYLNSIGAPYAPVDGNISIQVSSDTTTGLDGTWTTVLSGLSLPADDAWHTFTLPQ